MPAIGSYLPKWTWIKFERVSSSQKQICLPFKHVLIGYVQKWKYFLSYKDL